MASYSTVSILTVLLGHGMRSKSYRGFTPLTVASMSLCSKVITYIISPIDCTPREYKVDIFSE